MDEPNIPESAPPVPAPRIRFRYAEATPGGDPVATSQVRADSALCRQAIATCEERVVALAAELGTEVWRLSDLGVEHPWDHMLDLTDAVWRGTRKPSGVYEVDCRVTDAP